MNLADVVPQDESGAPVIAYVVLGLLVVGALVALTVMLARRR